MPVLLCIGCAAIPHRTIFVTDRGGKPVPGATVSPYPILLRSWLPGSAGNSTDAHGRITLYEVVPGGDYTLSARGFSSRRIRFPQHDSRSYMLESAD